VAKYVVAPVDSVPPGTQRQVVVAGRTVALFNTGGTFRALRDVCPHRGAQLSQGTVVRSVTASAPGCYELDANRVLVKCPWHGWEFDLETGQSWCEPVKQRVRPYPVSVEPGERLVAADTGPQPGPYVAETITVSVEDDYIVVELHDQQEMAAAAG
jgi:3-phenylpropionate/trans-cinnamate dioxygenase ferredoxin subunit